MNASTNQSDRSTSGLVASGERHNSPGYAPAPIVFDHGEGVYLYDRDGNAYLDFLGGVAVNALGYNHPDLTEALREQVGRALHVSNHFYSAEQIELLERVVDVSFGDRAFLCNSGTEAVEASLKLARRYQATVAGEDDKSQIVAMENSFHGRTMGSISATGQPKYQKGYEPLLPNIAFTPYNDIEAALETIDEATGAVIVEPIQGEGGVVPAEPDFLRALRERCGETGALLIFDEVQTGVGRTGRMFAYETYGVEPDIMAVAKGFGGGFPAGGCISTREIFQGWTVGSHASTFGGNPMASIAAKTVLEVIERDELLENTRERGAQLTEALDEFVEARDYLDEVRGRGLLVGVECGSAASDLADCCRKEGLLVNAAGGRAIRFAPPLVVTASDVDEAVERFERALDRYES